MAIRTKTKPKHFKFWLSTLQHTELKKRARELGYPSASSFVRCLACRELVNPSMDVAKNVIGRRPRKVGLSRPKH